MTLVDGGRHADEAPGLVPEKSRAFDHLLELLELRRRERLRARITTKEGGRDHVDALVRTLRAEDRSDE